MFELREYQKKAIENVRNAFKAGAHAPLLVAPCGMGKTVIFTHITAAMAQRGRRVTILVHRRELIAQASRKLTQAGVDHGIIAAGTPATFAPIQVASVQTLIRRLEDAPAPDLLIIDEAHHAANATMPPRQQYAPAPSALLLSSPSQHAHAVAHHPNSPNAKSNNETVNSKNSSAAHNVASKAQPVA